MLIKKIMFPLHAALLTSPSSNLVDIPPPLAPPFVLPKAHRSCVCQGRVLWRLQTSAQSVKQIQKICVIALPVTQGRWALAFDGSNGWQ
jgi:hypothetical protein